jgi:formylglycine-generating enzyme
MITKVLVKSVGALVMLLLITVCARADVFNMPNGQKSLEFVTVGNPGNANDTQTGYGSVSESYLIGKYEVTNAQWREFLTAKAGTSDLYGLYNTGMSGTYGGIDRTWLVDHYVYTAKGRDANWDNRPVNFVGLWDAARFCNWLHNGAKEDSDTETGAYVNIGNLATFARQSGAKYFVPTENEWYKAAYYDPNKSGAGVPGYWDYPMMSDDPTVPSNDLIAPDPGNNANFYQNGYTLGAPYYTTLVGDFENSASAYGTFDQGGNFFEWNATVLYGASFVLRGGSYADGSFHTLADHRINNVPTYESNGLGFRVASVPEPGSIALLVTGTIISLLVCVWRHPRP